MSTGELIRKYRLEKNLTQKELGARCGLADSAIRRYENGRSNPKLETLNKIAIALDVSLADLVLTIQVHNTTDSIQNSNKRVLHYASMLLQNSEIPTPEEINLKNALYLFRKLNTIGQEKALERLEELTQISRYTDL